MPLHTRACRPAPSGGCHNHQARAKSIDAGRMAGATSHAHSILQRSLMLHTCGRERYRALMQPPTALRAILAAVPPPPQDKDSEGPAARPPAGLLLFRDDSTSRSTMNPPRSLFATASLQPPCARGPASLRRARDPRPSASWITARRSGAFNFVVTYLLLPGLAQAVSISR